MAHSYHQNYQPTNQLVYSLSYFWPTNHNQVKTPHLKF